MKDKRTQGRVVAVLFGRTEFCGNRINYYRQVIYSRFVGTELRTSLLAKAEQQNNQEIVKIIGYHSCKFTTFQANLSHMRKFTWLLVLVVFYIPGLAQAQQPSVVTLFSEYCDGFYHFDGSIGASCSSAYIRQHADVVDERNGYLEIYDRLSMRCHTRPTLKVAHYIHKGTHLLAVAEYEMTPERPGQELKIYQWTVTETERRDPRALCAEAERRRTQHRLRRLRRHL